MCATRAGVISDDLACKISLLRKELVIICATRTGANLGVLGFKISV